MLTLPLMAQDEEWRWSQSIQQSTSGYYSPDAYPDVKAIRTPQSIAEVIAALPAFPSVENIYCEEAKDKALRATFAQIAVNTDDALVLLRHHDIAPYHIFRLTYRLLQNRRFIYIQFSIWSDECVRRCRYIVPTSKPIRCHIYTIEPA